MCGIFGFIAPSDVAWDAQYMRNLISDLMTRSEPRGRDAAGLVVISNGEADVYKKAMRPDRLLALPEFQTFMTENLGRATGGGDRTAHPVAVIGHCRLVTNGAEVVPGNNQPIIAGNTVGIHNGIVVNDSDLWRRHPEITRHLESDSEIIFSRIDNRVAAGAPLATALREVFDEIEGTASVAFYCDRDETLALATNNGALYFAHLETPGVLVFASERFILSSFLKANAATLGGNGTVQQVRAGQAMLVPLASALPTALDLTADPAQQPAAPAVADGSDRPAFILNDQSERISDIKRCTRCILPATYPFIEFDDAGVCNYCRTYTPPTLKGEDALKAALAQHRRDDGEIDCVIALSGGRDSSYGLHVLRKEYGMTPIAFSYDWGMVTDIARRNQARMCGQLGVEHVFRAADVAAKRRYIRKNIQAWLKRPHLGMIPLFSAGDKFFLDIARELRQETQVPLVVFCAGNPLERTDFKTGFAGVRESQHAQVLFAFSLSNKLQLAAFYASQYLLNPAYLNESLLDSLGAFRSSFVGKDDFLYLFHYLKWDEEQINDTLIGRYGWETAPHTDNTWRIGDGYTWFINYIYHTVAGFSEFDTFRSQQVRAGLLTREDALRLAAKDNQPDLPTLYEFAGQIGINLEEVLIRIDAIPKLY